MLIFSAPYRYLAAMSQQAEVIYKTVARSNCLGCLMQCLTTTMLRDPQTPASPKSSTRDATCGRAASSVLIPTSSEKSAGIMSRQPRPHPDAVQTPTAQPCSWLPPVEWAGVGQDPILIPLILTHVVTGSKTKTRCDPRVERGNISSPGRIPGTRDDS